VVGSGIVAAALIAVFHATQIGGGNGLQGIAGPTAAPVEPTRPIALTAPPSGTVGIATAAPVGATPVVASSAAAPIGSGATAASAQPTGAILPGGPPSVVTFDKPGQQARLTFQVSAGQQMSLHNTNNTLTYDLDLLQPDGRNLTSGGQLQERGRSRVAPAAVANAGHVHDCRQAEPQPREHDVQAAEN
jgi:hypothetical protein